MRCPYCNETEDRVVDSRTNRDGRSIRRRRECASCGRRFTTYEYVEERPIQVRKVDGSIESYDRRKLEKSVRIACVKRPISLSQIEALVDELEDELHQLGRDEVETRVVGEMVMDRLKDLDHIAYVRFASVYRDFQDIDEFYEELRDLSRRRDRAAVAENQVELPLP